MQKATGYSETIAQLRSGIDQKRPACEEPILRALMIDFHDSVNMIATIANVSNFQTYVAQAMPMTSRSGNPEPVEMPRRFTSTQDYRNRGKRKLKVFGAPSLFPMIKKSI